MLVGDVGQTSAHGGYLCPAASGPSTLLDVLDEAVIWWFVAVQRSMQVGASTGVPDAKIVPCIGRSPPGGIAFASFVAHTAIGKGCQGWPT
jgi:hypothetical protein